MLKCYGSHTFIKKESDSVTVKLIYFSLIIFSPSLLDKLKNSTEAISQKLSVEEGEKFDIMIYLEATQNQ